MYSTVYFFSRLSARLNELLAGARLVECFSQQRDELVMEFFTPDEKRFFLKADLSRVSGLITFPTGFNRTRSHSVDLFPELLGSPLNFIRQTKSDRSFTFRFANGFFLCFKLYGTRSNLLMHDGRKVISVFNHHLKKDLEVPLPVDRLLMPEYHPDPKEFRRLNPTFSKRMVQVWEEMSAEVPEAERPTFFKEWEAKLLKGPLFICRMENEVFLSFFRAGEVLLETADPLEASNALSKWVWQVNRFHKEKEALVRTWQEMRFHSQRQLEMIRKQIRLGEESGGYRRQADLLMAYGHTLEKGAEFAVLPDFEGEGTVEIRLKKGLSAVENAERLYRKARGQQQDLDRLHKAEADWLTTEKTRSQQLERLCKAEIWPDLKPYLKTSSESGRDTDSQPFEVKWFLDYEIWVGRNARSNEELLRNAHKDDLWLHARDVPGSHVLIRTRKGKPTPKPVIERAAEWAAYHSKARNEGLSPVMVTERKYVRKGRQMAPGQVKVEKEKTLLVVPRE